MKRLLTPMLLVCAYLFAMTVHATARSPAIPADSIVDPLSDAGRAYFEGAYTKAAVLYRPLAGQGHAEAQLILGSMYDIGLGVPQDYLEAARWYRLAAEQGNAKAQSKLGSMYDIGLGVPHDHKEAAKWWRLAAEKGDAFAQLNLGAIYDRGASVTQDFKEAVKWYLLAAEQGNAFAQEKLGWKYVLGKGVSQDDVLAYMWFNIAASEDSSAGRHAAIKQRDSIATRMTAEQIAKARELARKCIAEKFKGCGHAD